MFNLIDFESDKYITVPLNKKNKISVMSDKTYSNNHS